MRHRHPLLLALACVLIAAAPGASATGVRIAGVDVSNLPQAHLTVVTPTPSVRAPELTENDVPVYGLTAENLGSAKSIVVAVDRSRSMIGAPIRDAVAGARSFVRSKTRSDRVAIVGFGSRAIQLTRSSSATIDSDSALRTLSLDPKQGTALWEAVVKGSQALAGDPLSARVLIVLTDGVNTVKGTDYDDAVAAARAAGAIVYAIGLEGDGFSPGPLQELTQATGGRYFGAANTAAIADVYASITREFRRTWRVSYYSSARPGHELDLVATVPGFGSAEAHATVPGGSGESGASEPSKLVPAFVFEHRIGAALVTLVVGICVLLAAALALTIPRGTRLRRRLEPHLGEPKRSKVKGSARDKLAPAEGMLSATERAFGNFNLWKKLQRLIDRADVPLRAVEVFYMGAGAGLLFGMVAALSAQASFVILIAMAVGAMGPIVVLWWKARKRLAAIENSLPDILITIAASLKAGHSFRQGLQSVVEEGQGPASKEFKRVLTETRLGRPMDDALDEMAERVGSKNLQFVITAVTIQRQVGGSLAGIFDMVADAVRDRQQFARKIKGLTAMGRMSAYVLIGLPFFIAGAVTLINAEFMDPLYHSSAGHKLIITGLIMMAIGSVLLHRIVSFKG